MSEEQKFSKISIHSNGGKILQFGERRYKKDSPKEKFQKEANKRIDNLQKCKQAILALNYKLKMVDGEIIYDSDTRTYKSVLELDYIEVNGKKIENRIEIDRKKDENYVVYCNNEKYEFELKDGEVSNLKRSQLGELKRNFFGKKELRGKSFNGKLLYENMSMDEIDKMEEYLQLIKDVGLNKEKHFSIASGTVSLQRYNEEMVSNILNSLETTKQIDVVVMGQNNMKSVDDLIKDQGLKENLLKKVDTILPQIEHQNYVDKILAADGKDLYVKYQNGSVYKIEEGESVSLKKVNSKDIKSIEKSYCKTLVKVDYDFKSKVLSTDNIQKEIDNEVQLKQKLNRLLEIDKSNSKQLKSFKNINKDTISKIKDTDKKIADLNSKSKLKIVKYVMKNTLKLKNIKGVWKAPVKSMLEDRKEFIKEKEVLETFNADLEKCIETIKTKEDSIDEKIKLVESALKSKDEKEYKKMGSEFSQFNVEACDTKEDVMSFSKKYNDKPFQLEKGEFGKYGIYEDIRKTLNEGLIEEYKKGEVQNIKSTPSQDTLVNESTKEMSKVQENIKREGSEDTLVGDGNQNIAPPPPPQPTVAANGIPTPPPPPPAPVAQEAQAAPPQPTEPEVAASSTMAPPPPPPRSRANTPPPVPTPEAPTQPTAPAKEAPAAPPPPPAPVAQEAQAAPTQPTAPEVAASSTMAPPPPPPRSRANTPPPVPTPEAPAQSTAPEVAASSTMAPPPPPPRTMANTSPAAPAKEAQAAPPPPPRSRANTPPPVPTPEAPTQTTAPAKEAQAAPPPPRSRANTPPPVPTPEAPTQTTAPAKEAPAAPPPPQPTVAANGIPTPPPPPPVPTPEAPAQSTAPEVAASSNGVTIRDIQAARNRLKKRDNPNKTEDIQEKWEQKAKGGDLIAALVVAAQESQKGNEYSVEEYSVEELQERDINTLDKFEKEYKKAFDAGKGYEFLKAVSELIKTDKEFDGNSWKDRDKTEESIESHKKELEKAKKQPAPEQPQNETPVQNLKDAASHVNEADEISQQNEEIAKQASETNIETNNIEKKGKENAKENKKEQGIGMN